jgi:hypothetical protein
VTDATTATQDSATVAPVATATVETAAAEEEAAGDPVVQHGADELQNGGPGNQPKIREADPNANRNLPGGGGGGAAAPTPLQGPDTAVPVTTVHAQEWFEPGEETIKLKSVPRRQWKVKNIFGEDVYPALPASLHMPRLDFFLLMFPDDQLTEMLTLTNRELRK